MRIISALLLLLSFAVSTLAQTVSTPKAKDATGKPPIEIFTAMRDGTKLAADVYLPEGKGPWPVVLTRTPYLKNGMYNPQSALRYTHANFAFVVQDVRGKGHSQGFYSAFTNDVEDGYDTVEEIAKESWSNGQIGMTGASAMGITTNLAAVGQPPHLKAAYVIVAPYWSFTTSFLGGVPKDQDNVGWLRLQKVDEDVIARTQLGATHSVWTDRGGPGPYMQYVSIPMWNVGGWFDIFNTGTIANFELLQNHGAKGARGNQRLTMFPFGHGALTGDLAYPNLDNLLTMMSGQNGNDEIRWFSYWLRGEQNGVMDDPPVDAYVMAAARKDKFSPKNHWIHAANWPLAYRETRFFLTPKLGLSNHEPTIDAAKTSYKFDPANPVKTFGGANLMFDRGPQDQRQVSKRQDYLRFETPVLDKDTTVAGPVTVELYAATDGPDTDFVAKLVDVYPDGYEALLLDAPIRTRYRSGRGQDDIRMMTPNAPEKLVIDLWNTANTFEKGHRIAVHITSSNSPRFLVNRNNGDEPTAPQPPRVATNTIYFDKTHPSAIVLPIVYLND